MKRHHEMPFGAECRNDGNVRFRLWAPAANKVEICLEDDGHESAQLPLQRLDQGWYELVTDASGPGTRYSFRIDDKLKVPDPASRFQPLDVDGPSEVIAPEVFDWEDSAWRGRRWEEAIIYELHVGAFTPQGNFAAVRERLNYLAKLGITAIELMPVADFPGQRNWGYDGVLPFAPDSSYGRPEDLKQLVQTAHQLGIMVFLDVVYNHFGPEGNYLNSYAPQFFTDRHHTPWGKALNFDGPASRTVRDFFIHNALYWLHEYNFDGLRLDAVHAIVDDSTPDFLTELADAIAKSCTPDRQIHLILENDRNQSRYLRRTPSCKPRFYTAQWNDDIHHALHVLLTGERESYYRDYEDRPLDQLARCLVTGFSYQGESSKHRNGELRGESTEGTPLTAFVSFLQNHDQIGNRAFGERINMIADPRAVHAATAILLLAPSPPMLFMGEEFGAEAPFLFFCDFKGDLAAAVTNGRRAEFSHFSAFNDSATHEQIPDPNAISTFESSRINWASIEEPQHRECLDFHGRLLLLRTKYVIPRLSQSCAVRAEYSLHHDRGLVVHWTFPDRSKFTLAANLGTETISVPGLPTASIIYATCEGEPNGYNESLLAPWSVVWFLEE